MNIKITDGWLKEHLETRGSAKKIAECLSLCGPSVEKLEHESGDWIYEIEVTTNRVDMMSVRGIAREAAAILPEFGIKAKLRPLHLNKVVKRSELGITIINNTKLCEQILAIKLEDLKLKESPRWMAERLKMVGQRPLNNVVDITNYVMWELGQPIHAFDYDRIENKKIVVREARKGEELVTLDGQRYKLHGGEVIFDNGKGEIIDLPGIMGTANTVVTSKTKNVLLWMEAVEVDKIRQASMKLGIRTHAAIINEKEVDPDGGQMAIMRAVKMFQELAGAKLGSRLVEMGKRQKQAKEIKVQWEMINNRLGIELEKTRIRSILERLGFEAQWQGKTLRVKAPSYRADDIEIGEDIVEEVARIYGYYRLPSVLMKGELPEKKTNDAFDFEMKIKQILKTLSGNEVYTSSLTDKTRAGKGALEIKNPLGEETRYLRTGLTASLRRVVEENKGEKDKAWMFEMANIYYSVKNNLPEERMMIAGIFSRYNYREAKGIVEGLLEGLNVIYLIKQADWAEFEPNKALEIWSGSEKLGRFGQLVGTGYYYWEFEMEKLRARCRPYRKFQPIGKYPAQIEDITFSFPARTKIGEVIELIKKITLVEKVELTVIYQDNYTFRIWYQSPIKTLKDQEVRKIRKTVVAKVGKKFGGVVRE